MKHASLHVKGIDPYKVTKLIFIELYLGLILLYQHYIYERVKRLCVSGRLDHLVSPGGAAFFTIKSRSFVVHKMSTKYI